MAGSASVRPVFLWWCDVERCVPRAFLARHKKDSTMKQFLLSIFLLAGFSLSASAMSYEEARQNAWFLTDKMAYELNLTPEQYDMAYQVNFDYFSRIASASDCYGPYWAYRNADLSCILFDWQYNLYCSVEYFFRPIRWVAAAWYFPVFDYYRRGYYYFSRPTVYVTYRGAMWNRRGHNSASPYRSMTFRPGNGMRDRYNRGHNVARPGARPGYGRPGYNPPAGGRPSQQRPGQGNGRPGNSNVRPGQGNSRPGNRDGNSRPSTSRGNQNGGQGNARPSVSRGNPGNNRGNSGSSRRSSSSSGSQRGHSGGSRTFGR